MKFLIFILLAGSFVWAQETVTDIDGNVYQTVQIGNQLWMKENLKVTHYQNGDEIPTGYSNDDWPNLSTGAYAVYDDNESNANTYGNLYNWYAVDDSRAIAPEGWHVPTDDEIKQLEIYLGMSQEEADGEGWRGTNEGSKLAGRADLWGDGNLENNPEFGTSGFNLLPGGYRYGSGGGYEEMPSLGYFWSSTEDPSHKGWYRKLYIGNSNIDRYTNNRKDGYSVRCVRDASWGGTILVPEDYPTIQAGINAAYNGDTVLVLAGTYIENINYNGKNISVIGEDRETTIIDGGGNGSVVTFESGEDTTSVLSGFTVTNGSGTQSDPFFVGGGIYCSFASPKLLFLIITENMAFEGGGVFMINSSPILDNVLISNHQSVGEGGGIYCTGGSPTLMNVIIENNTTYHQGAGIRSSSYLILNNVVINDNHVIGGSSGGGVAGGSGVFTNVTIVNNSTESQEGVGGIEGSGINLINSIVFGNLPNQIVGAVTATYSDIQGSWEGEGNIDANPRFCNTDDGDYTLGLNSPCIGTGQGGTNMGAFGVGCELIWLYGCTDSTASNYDQDADFDNGSCCVELWGECYNIETTSVLDLSNSNLTGSIPPEIGNLTNLTGLDLDWNYLTGSIPSEIGNLTNLTSLDLGSNNLTGSIPPEIGNLTNLTSLDLEFQELAGSIPPEIGNLTNLTSLELEHNYLTGSIPPEIGNLTNLTGLDLDWNYLTGSIPPEIGNLTNLTFLYLKNNELTGEIPESICDLNINWSSSGDFRFSNNQLCPPYPSCIEEYVGEQNTSECVYYSGPTWHVSTDGTDGEGYGSEEHPFATIQYGIDAASDGDTVLVSAGTYVENINFNGKNIVVQGEDRETTIIDGGGQWGEESLVTFKNGENSTAVLSGFKVTGNNSGDFNGGGVTIHNSSPTLRNLDITGNMANQRGGGIYCREYSSPLIEDVIIRGNTAITYGGGGVYLFQSSPTMINLSIEGNTASNSGFGGGGMYLEVSNPSLTNITFSGNSASDGGGGGMYLDTSNPSLTDVTFSSNSSDYGGGIYCRYSSSPSLTSVTITNNTATQDGGGIFCRNLSSPILENVTISSNTASGFGAGIACADYSSPTLTDVLINGNVGGEGAGIWFGTGSSSTLTDVTVTNNISSGSGGGISFETFDELDSPTLTDVTISSNSAREGGGIACYISSPNLINVVITDNEATDWWGGGISLESASSPSLENVTINGNAAVKGGGISCSESSSPSLTSVTITNNTATLDGGGIHCSGMSNPSLENVTITGNTAENWGGGISCDNVSSPSLENVTISDNAADKGGGISCKGVSSPSLVNCILWNDLSPEVFLVDEETLLTVSYSDIQGGEAGIETSVDALGTVSWGDGNIDANPLFCNADSSDYTLAENSLCVGTGQYNTNMGAFGVGCITIIIEPTISDIPDTTINEDENLLVSLSVESPIGYPMIYSASSNTADVIASIEGESLTLSPTDNWNGSALITVTVTDEFLSLDSTSFILTVQPVNDAPEALNVSINPALPTLYDDLVLSYDYFDVDGGDDESGTIFTWFKNGMQQSDFANQLYVPGDSTECDEEWYSIVTPSDGELFGEPDTSNTVLICATNTAPVWSEIDDQNLDEDSGENTVDISSYITDAEQDISQMTFQVFANSNSDHLGAEFDGYNLLLTPLVLDYHSTEQITLTLQADDNYGGVVTQTVNIFINPVNDAPVLIEIGNRITDEDTPLAVTLGATDVDEDDLTFSAVSEYPENVAVEVTGNQLTMAPAADWNGIANVTVTVSDGFLTDEETFILMVNPVNDAPTIDLPDAFAFAEDGSLVEHFNGYVDDIDEDGLVLTVSDTVNIIVSISGFEVTFGALQDWNGIEALTFTINDNQGREIATDSVDVIVTPVNDAPILTEIGNQETSEDTSLVLTLEATDVDEDDLTFSAVSEYPENVAVEVTGNQLTMAPAADWNGMVSISVTVSDGFLTDLEIFEIAVNPVNDAPVIADQNTLITEEDISLVVTFEDLIVTDVDNTYPEDFTLTVLEGDNYTVDGATITPELDYNGDLTVPIYVDDGEVENSQSNTFELIVTVTPVNDAPEFTSTPITSAVEDAGYSYTAVASDVDLGDSLTFAAPTLPDWLTFDDVNTISGTPLNEDVGPHNILLTVSDLEGAIVVEQSFTINVANTNDAPVFTSTPITSVLEDAGYSYTAVASDVDLGDVLIFAAPTLPDWLDFDVATQILSGTPLNEDVGDHDVTVTVSDGAGNDDFTVEQSFIITVVNTNDVPVISGQVELETQEETPLEITLSDLTVTDVDNTYPDEFTLTVLGGNNYEVDGATITPDLDYNGDFTVSVYVDDGEVENSQSDTFELIVTVIPVNDAPWFTSTPADSVMEDEEYSYTAVASDVDLGDVLIFAAPTLPDWLDFDVATQILSGTPLNEDVGDHDVTVTVSDGAGNDDFIVEQSFTITVVNTNDRPYFYLDNAPVGLYEDFTQIETIVIVYSYDDDGDTLVFSITPDVSWVNMNIDPSSGTVTIESVPDSSGAQLFTVTADDQTGESNSDTTDTFMLVVNPVNDAPMFSLSDTTIVLMEDFEDTITITIEDYFDADGDPSEFSLNPSAVSWANVSIDPSSGTVMIASVQDSSDEGTFLVVANDGNGGMGFDTFVLIVNPVNDAPSLTLGSYSDTLVVDNTYSIPLSAEDIDSYTLTFSVANNPPWALLEGDELQLLPDTAGIDTFQIIVNDGDLSDEEDYIVTVIEPRPVITAVSDVPDDQGGWVYVQFNKSYFDTDTLRDIELYHVERMDNEEWVSIGSSAAYGAEYYIVLAPTVHDSTSQDSALQDFRVIASMNEGTFASIPEGGYSIDNLPPDVPGNFTAEAEEQAVALSWDSAGENDFDHYNLYRSEDENFVPDDSTLIATLMENSYLDTVVDLNILYAYKLSSVDIHENESDHTETVIVGILANDTGLSLPTVYALHYNYPNPFNPITSLRYDLPRQAQVTLTVYDLMGREIAQLVNTTQEAGYKSVQWNATDMHGRPVSAGVYLCQIRAGEFVQTRKMVFLK